MQLSVIAIRCHRLRKRRPSDQNSSKYENSYSKLEGPMFTLKFGKLSLQKKRSADDVKKQKHFLNKGYFMAKMLICCRTQLWHMHRIVSKIRCDCPCSKRKWNILFRWPHVCGRQRWKDSLQKKAWLRKAQDIGMYYGSKEKKDYLIDSNCHTSWEPNRFLFTS